MTTTEQDTAPVETDAATADATEAPKAKGDKDFTKYVEKEPTNLHHHYWGWIKDKTGIDLGVSDDVAVKIVQIAVSAYQVYQASPENKQRRVDEADAREKAAEEAKAKKAADAAEKAKKAADAAEAKKAEAEAAGETDAPKARQAPPKKGRAASGSATKAAAGEAPF